MIVHGVRRTLSEKSHQILLGYHSYIVLRYIFLLFQASYSNHRRPVSMAGQKRYLGYINHPYTKGWDGT